MTDSRKLVPMAAVIMLATAPGGIVAQVVATHRGVLEIRYTETT